MLIQIDTREEHHSEYWNLNPRDEEGGLPVQGSVAEGCLEFCWMRQMTKTCWVQFLLVGPVPLLRNLGNSVYNAAGGGKTMGYMRLGRHTRRLFFIWQELQEIFFKVILPTMWKTEALKGLVIYSTTNKAWNQDSPRCFVWKPSLVLLQHHVHPDMFYVRASVLMSNKSCDILRNSPCWVLG